MDSKAITPRQAKAICEALFPGTNYLVRLRLRMEETGFPRDDDLYQHVCAAYDAIQRLRMKTHYMSCSGVGSPSGFGKP